MANGNQPSNSSVNNLENLKSLKDKNERIIQRHIKTQQKLKNLQLPDCVRNISPSFYDQYQRLIAYEKSLDECLNKHKKLLSEAQAFPFDSHSNYNLHQKLRIHIYNTYENQKSKDFELNSLDPQQLLHSGPPSWSLRLQGNVLEKDDDITPIKFSSFFSRIMILDSYETILWEKGLEDNPDVDGIEINRIGDKEYDISILLFFDYKIPTFSLSESLSCFLQTGRSTLPAIVSTIWNHTLTHCVPNDENPPRFYPDSQLSLLFEGVEIFGLSDIPRLLSVHLLPPQPILLTHKLKLRGDWVQNCQTYDIIIDSINLKSNPNNVPPLTFDDGIEQKQQIFEEIDKELAKCLEKLNAATIRRNFYKSFSNAPLKFINSILNSKFSGSEKTLLDENFLNEYKVSDDISKYYNQPWLSNSIDRYLEKRNSIFEDNICNVVASMSIPDPRRIKSEDEEVSGSKRMRVFGENSRTRINLVKKKKSRAINNPI